MKRLCLLQYFLAISFLLIFSQIPLQVRASPDESDEFAQSILEKTDDIRFPRDSFQVDVDIRTTSSDQPDNLHKY